MGEWGVGRGCMGGRSWVGGGRLSVRGCRSWVRPDAGKELTQISFQREVRRGRDGKPTSSPLRLLMTRGGRTNLEIRRGSIRRFRARASPYFPSL